ERLGAGPKPCRRSRVRIVVAPTRMPSLRSSPAILTQPQRGFSLAIRTTSAASLGLLGRRLLNICVKFSEDEVESGVRSTSADTLSDQPLSEWPAGREADRTLAQRTAAVGLTGRGSLSELALMADRPVRLADDHGVDLGGPRQRLTGGPSLRCSALGCKPRRRPGPVGPSTTDQSARRHAHGCLPATPLALVMAGGR